MPAKYIYWLIAGVFLIIISPNFLSHGMFMDGVIYASVARNLAESHGSWWAPFFTETRYPQFFEHPPLMFWLLSFFYKVFGDHFFIEKIFSLSCVAVSCFLLHRIWSVFKLTNDSWLPILLFCSFPLIIWTATNNMLENLLLVQLTAAVFYMIRFVNQRDMNAMLAASLLLCSAILTKGPVGLFVLVFPLTYGLLYAGKSVFNSLLDTAILSLSTVSITAAIFLFNASAFHFLEAYYKEQILHGMKDVMMVTSRWKIISFLGAELIIPALLMLAAWQWRDNKAHQKADAQKGLMLSFFLTGMCGVFPFMISLKQSNFYIIPSLPFFALGAAIFVQQNVGSRIMKESWIGWKYWTLIVSAVFLIAIASIVINTGKINRDRNMLRDIFAIKETIPQNKVLQTCLPLKDNFGLEAYLQRYGHWSLDTRESHQFYFYSADCGTPKPSEIILPSENHSFFIYKTAPDQPPVLRSSD